jgi:hypothetical protein
MKKSTFTIRLVPTPNRRVWHEICRQTDAKARWAEQQSASPRNFLSFIGRKNRRILRLIDGCTSSGLPITDGLSGCKDIDLGGIILIPFKLGGGDGKFVDSGSRQTSLISFETSCQSTRQVSTRRDPRCSRSRQQSQHGADSSPFPTMAQAPDCVFAIGQHKAHSSSTG